MATMRGTEEQMVRMITNEHVFSRLIYEIQIVSSSHRVLVCLLSSCIRVKHEVKPEITLTN